MKFLARTILAASLAASLSWGYSDTVYQVQTQLNNLGYNVGSADGVIGRGTSRAIRQYQEDNGLRVNGRITNELLSSMGIRRGSNTTQNSNNYQSTSNNTSSWGSGSGALVDNLKNGKYQIGFLAAWPSYGLSLKVDYSDKINLEIVAAPMGTFSIYSAKVNYYLTKERKYNTYAYVTGGVGIYEYPGLGSWDWETGSYKDGSETETVPMFGAGVGIEWSWRKILGNDIPNLYSTVEFGYANMSFDYYNFGGFLYGGGIYYKF